MKSAKKNIWQKIKEYCIQFYFRNRPVTRNQQIRAGILSVSVLLFLFCAGQLGLKMISDAVDARNNDRIASLRSSASASASASAASDPGDSIVPSSSSGNSYENSAYTIIEGTDTVLNASGRLPEYEDLWQRNNDMAGWISIPGFTAKDIYYPILFSGDNGYYLNRNFDKEYAKSGSVFLDESNSPYPQDPLALDYNYVIYGHAMLNKTMFGQLTNYFENETAWENATTIYIDFMNTRLEYEVFSTFLVDPDYNYRQTSFSSNKEYQAYLDNLIAISTHDFGIDVGVEDRIVTLSTCYKSTQRTGIVGKLVKQIIYEQGSGSQTLDITPVVLPTDEPASAP